MFATSILNFPAQFSYEPIIENLRALKKFDEVFFIGMGGSHLAADLALRFSPELPLSIWSDYGLPPQYKRVKRPLIIVGSYSGNTEETIDGYKLARKYRLPVVVIASGGTLIDLAKKHNHPFIQIPQTGIQPRMATGFALRAIFKLLGDENGLKNSTKLSRLLDPTSLKKPAQDLTKKLQNRIPVIYASTKNFSLAYNWKIKFNETGKIPAFYNLLPELNHNEMNGFDVMPSIESICKPFTFIFLQDKQDHPRIQKRMAILEKMYNDRRLPVLIQPLTGKNLFEKIFTSLLIADWTAFFIATHNNLEPEQVPMVETFKHLMQ